MTTATTARTTEAAAVEIVTFDPEDRYEVAKAQQYIAELMGRHYVIENTSTGGAGSYSERLEMASYKFVTTVILVQR